MRSHASPMTCRARGAPCWLALALFAGVSCAQGGPTPQAPAPDSEIQVLLDQDMMQRGGAPAEAWAAYGVMLLYAASQPSAMRLDDYGIELAARTLLANFWNDRPAEERARDAYLQALVAVEQAGYLDEYVVVNLARPGWTIPAEALARLDLAGFAAWQREHLAEHRVETWAAIERADALPARVPGEDLPSVAELNVGGEPCAELPKAAAAFAAWREEEARLPGAALVARDRAIFLAALALAREDAAYRGRDITWVSERAAEVSFLTGFCEIERQNVEASVEALRTAVRLEPLAAMSHLELASALIVARDLDASMREIQTAIALSDDRCRLGSAWRRKGYVEIELGRLDDAERSYRKSLEYDPQSKLARSELLIIAKQRAASGGEDDGSTPPPAAGEMTRSVCPGE